MKRNIFQIVLTAAFLLSACGGTTAQPTPTIVSVIENSTPIPVPQYTNTPSDALHGRLSEPSNTPITPTIIPTLTPTFDARTIVTVTSASPAECPKVDKSLKPEFEFPNSLECAQNGGSQEKCFPNGLEKKFLAFLNSGGSVSTLVTQYISIGRRSNSDIFLKDVTGDKTPELMLFDFRLLSHPFIFHCNNGFYEILDPLPDAPPGYWINLIGIYDLNKNGLPEIIFTLHDCSGSGCFGISAVEWNGVSFEDTSPEVGILGRKDYSFQDIDKNGTTEIILTGDRPGSCCEADMIPWRYMTIVYSWNGSKFAESYRTFETPKYRFQTIQDGDRETKYGNYEKALPFYQDAIFSDKLEWWSENRKEYQVNEFYGTYYDAGSNLVTRTPMAIPVPDPTEYPKLASYAYYRIMLLHTVRGYKSDAGTVYNTLQQKFGTDPNGRPYTEMATAFWDTYQSTHKMYDSCAAAIQYADEHPEILIPLGSDYHGWQSHTYVAEDVCPFR